MKLLDATLLSNFAYPQRLDLLAAGLPDAATTPQVMAELQAGEAAGRLPPGDWNWLTIVTLSTAEETHFQQIRQILGDGEASCLAVALARPATFFSDDRDARRYAQKLRIPVSGTLGALALFVNARRLTLTQANALLQTMIRAGYHSPVTTLDELYDFDENY